ncbi:hypothetical protein Apa02nite_076450 [Actinoplanes palleronii]|uniref:Uncharacterized protein n=1 Tax=Actinoplanes palleronii TaxID=113570 RepID=A0ABQ4BLJ0_9ACTN|nr:hypothetical protein Apa02nite_076450 [Actinoplanes palleronii]
MTGASGVGECGLPRIRAALSGLDRGTRRERRCTLRDGRAGLPSVPARRTATTGCAAWRATLSARCPEALPVVWGVGVRSAPKVPTLGGGRLRTEGSVTVGWFDGWVGGRKD